MKELTGGDPIQARALFKDSITFIPQFKLVVCTNTLFDIASNDEGTWRRIRVCDFMSKFKEQELIDEDPEEPYQFIVDKKLDKKFPVWKEVFMSMLIEKVKVTKGLVKDCSVVLEHSKQYRASQDYISAFVQEKIMKQRNAFVEKNEINQEFKMWWVSNYGQGRKEPPAREVHEYIDRNYGKCRDGVWKNIKIKYNSNKITNIDEDDVDDINGDEL